MGLRKLTLNLVKGSLEQGCSLQADVRPGLGEDPIWLPEAQPPPPSQPRGDFPGDGCARLRAAPLLSFQGLGQELGPGTRAAEPGGSSQKASP